MGVALAQLPSNWRSGPVDAQFQGLARHMRERLKATASECNTEIDRITAGAVARSRRSPIPRAETLIGVARQWRALPSFGRLDLTVQLGKRSLYIQELRVCPADFRAAHWTVDERSFSVCGLVLDIAPFRFDFGVPNLITIGMHAVSRWFQRGLVTTDQQFMADMQTLVRAHAELVCGDDGSQFEIATNGGRFVGSLVAARDATSGAVDKPAVVRTFK
jgi:hypothetical protein